MNERMSAATRRAAGYYAGAEFFCDFRFSPARGLDFEKGICRRDPSAVIKVADLFYVWYTKAVMPNGVDGFDGCDAPKRARPWDLADVWYATSPDGREWTEQGLAVGRGEPGAYDDRSVFTPDVLAHEGRYYLVYQVVKAPYVRRVKENIALAVADSPIGPWRKSPAPILRPVDNGAWEGDEDNRYRVLRKGDFDSLCVHDPCLLFYKEKFWLYYKGETMGEEMSCGGREIKWGVAIADKPEGPYVKSEYNPITNSGHEVIVWRWREGVCALLTKDGPERNTIQYAPDGLNFEIKAHISDPPKAAGPFRAPLSELNAPLDGLRWGLCHDVVSHPPFGFLRRFEVDEALKNRIMSKGQNRPR